MEKKSVCIIRSNPVKPDSRVEKEAWSLMNAGYDVHILAWDRDADTGEREEVIMVAGENIPMGLLEKSVENLFSIFLIFYMLNHILFFKNV